MGKYIGADWASKGWLTITLDDSGGGWQADLYPTIWSLWEANRDADRILIDIPIGLPTDGRRPCDIKAKEKLRATHRRVFYTPVRGAVYETNLTDAKEINEQAGYSIQNQAWSIVPRIREVDEFLDRYPNASDRLQETHPELCFYGLNGKTPLPEATTTDTGIEHRRRLLADAHPEADHIFKATVEQFTTPSYAPMIKTLDDIVDALAAAVTAALPPTQTTTLPATSTTDDRGLPMQMLYPSVTEQTRMTTFET